MDIGEVNNFFGDLDIELLDQILKGSFEDCESVLEIGCGQGRNLIYFMREGFHVFGVDHDKSAIQLSQYIANELGASENCNFSVQSANELSFGDASMDAVISCRVLHFAENQEDFLKMWNEQYRVLKPGGLLFISLDTTIGVDLEIDAVTDGKIRFPDNTIRFPLTDELMNSLKIDDSFDRLEPMKMINYDHQHSQVILVLQKK